MSAFDWPAMIQIGLRQMALSPACFWALTPAEFAVMLGTDLGAETLTRRGFEALMDAYPDQNMGTENG